MSGAYIVWAVAKRLAGRKMRENNGFCRPMLYFIVRLRVRQKANHGSPPEANPFRSICLLTISWDKISAIKHS
jgi:hypothetical protein